MSVYYFYSITVTGDPESINDFRNNFRERLRESIVAYFARFAHDNDLCEIVSLNHNTNVPNVEILAPGLGYNHNGVITPKNYEEEFLNELNIKCDLYMKYRFELGTRNRFLGEEVYMLSKCFPYLLFQHYYTEDTADGYHVYVLKYGEPWDRIDVYTTPRIEWRDDPL